MPNPNSSDILLTKTTQNNFLKIDLKHTKNKKNYTETLLKISISVVSFTYFNSLLQSFFKMF